MDFSLAEIVIILVVSLLVIGPKELPALAHKIGRVTLTVKKQWQAFWLQLETESAIKDIEELNDAAPRKIQGDDGQYYAAYDVPDFSDKAPEKAGQERQKP